jgi:crotonobetainyl-CoA:carnitine CoA-transferase CaiB-like acyl-CoA transferase
MRVLEIGSYVSIAYAGMILREQGCEVTKWLGAGDDPVQTLKGGDRLWTWLNENKTMAEKHASTVRDLQRGDFDVVIDNVRAETWQRWGIDPEVWANNLGVTWVSLRDDFDGRGFDAIAQARAWGDHIGYLPVYLGDTGGGLWLAFKALAMYANGERSEHFVIRQAACLAKLVEGELLEVERDGFTPPWDEPGTYGLAPEGHATEVHYRGEIIKEPFRSAQWRRENLRHSNGRLVI